jgi:chorismate mutase
MFMRILGDVHDMSLDTVRAEISKVDTEIIRLIAQRQKLAGKIAQIKVANSLPIHDRDRAADVLESVFVQAVESRIDPVSVQKIFEILIAMSEERQRECSGDGNLP